MLFFKYYSLNIVIYLALTLTCEAAIIQGNLPNALEISNFLDKIIKPYIQTLNIPPNDPLFRTARVTPVNKAIREKIAELKPFLQDEDNILKSNKELIEDSDETTIIEVEPKVESIKGNVRNTLKTNTTTTKMNLYNDLREKIKRYLNKENISRKTKKLILKTVDTLITQIIGSQCSWKSSDDFETIAVKLRNYGVRPILKSHNLTEQGWEHFKKQYIELNQDKHVAETLSLFNKFQDLFSKIIKDTTTLSKRYKIKCHLVNMDKNETEQLRQGRNMFRENDHDGECKNFKLCSEELKSFMIDFYKAVNDTAVSIFRNYAAMYNKDINSDTSEEKNSIVDLIYNISDIVESKTAKIFIKEISKLKLDEGKDKTENIKNLMQYVKNTVGHVKKSIRKNLEKYLKSLRARLFMTVKEDITANLEIELGNLEGDFRARICTVFVLCNGRYWSRRKKDSHSNPKLQIGDSKQVYVKMQLSLDETPKDDIARNRSALFSNFETNGIRKTHGIKNALNSTKIKTNEVTRTTRYIEIYNGISTDNEKLKMLQQNLL